METTRKTLRYAGYECDIEYPADLVIEDGALAHIAYVHGGYPTPTARDAEKTLRCALRISDLRVRSIRGGMNARRI